MAERLCFLVNKKREIEEKYIQFDYVKGMAFSQRVKCAASLDEAIKKEYPNLKHLEVSSKSSNELGRKLSAFNLMYGNTPLESIFQSSKVFDGDVQFEFLKEYGPADAKKYVRENHKGNLIKFRLNGIDYPINPKSAFYDWIYINALDESPFSQEVLEYDIFSDIEFNDKKSINCQARAVAIYVSICRKEAKTYYLSDFSNFLKLYPEIVEEQLSLFDM